MNALFVIFQDISHLGFNFPIAGPYLGAIGAMLNTLEGFIHSRKEAAAPAEPDKNAKEEFIQQEEEESTHF